MAADFFDFLKLCDTIDYFYYCSLILSVAVSASLFRRSDLPFRWLTILMMVTLVSESTAKYLAYGLGQSNNIVYHFFVPVEYTLYVVIVNAFLRHKKLSIYLWLSAVGLALFEIINTLYAQPLRVSNTNSIIMEGTLLVILALMLFLKIRQTFTQQNILRRGVFWIASAMLCYYACSIFIWGFHNMKVYLLDNPPHIIYDINLLLSGLLYLTYTIAIVINTRNTLQTH